MLLKIIVSLILSTIAIISLSAQDGLVWKKKISQKSLLSLAATDKGYGVSVADDTIKVWNLFTGDNVKQFYRKGVTSASVDSLHKYIIYATQGNDSANPKINVFDIVNDTIVSQIEVQKREGDKWYGSEINYTTTIGKGGMPFLVNGQIKIIKGQSNWDYGILIKAQYDESKKSVIFTQAETSLPGKLRISDDKKVVYGNFYSSSTFYYYPDTYVHNSNSEFSVYSLSSFSRINKISLQKNEKELAYPYLLNNDRTMVYLGTDVYTFPSLNVLRHQVIPHNSAIENLSSDIRFLCLPISGAMSIGIWNAMSRTWEYSYNGDKQVLLAMTSDNRYAVTSDEKGYVSLWRLPNFAHRDSLDVDFIYPEYKLFVGDNVTLKNYTFPYNDQYSFYWDFGDGRISRTMDTVITYTKSGDYTITLYVTSKGGVTEKQHHIVTIHDKPAYLLDVIHTNTKKKITSLDFSKDNSFLLFTSNHAANRYEISRKVSTSLFVDTNMFYTGFISEDTVVVLSHTSLADTAKNMSYAFPIQRPSIRYTLFNTRTKKPILSQTFPFLLEHYEVEAYWWGIHRFQQREFSSNIAFSGTRDWFAVSANVVSEYAPTASLDDLFSYRGDILHCDLTNLISVDNRSANKPNPCKPYLRSPITSLDIDSKGKYIAASTSRFYDGLGECAPYPPSILISEKGTKNVITILNDNTSCVRYSVDGYHLWSTTGIWDIDSNRKIVSLQTGLKGQFEVLPDGDHVVALSPPEKNALAGIYSMREQRWKAYYYGSSALGMTEVSALAVSSDGAYCALGSSTGSVTLWSIPELPVKPVADFRSSIRRVRVGDSVLFENMSVPYNVELQYEWDYGDGSKSNGRRGVHVYGETGLYDVRLRIKNGTGEESEKSVMSYIKVESASRVESSAELSVHVYPNPCDDVLTVACDQESEIMLYDIQGNELRKYSRNNQIQNIDTSEFLTGIYIVKVRTAHGIVVQSCVVRHE